MIKFILSNDEQYSYKYEPNISIKKILDDFCKRRGLLPDIYEAYDPVKLKVLDTTKYLNDYKINSLHLRRVDSDVSSVQDSQEKSSYDDSTGKLCNSLSIHTYSKNSFNANNGMTEKKNKKTIKFKFKRLFKKSTIDKSNEENLAEQYDNKMYTSSIDKINLNFDEDKKTNPQIDTNPKQEKKKKRTAPPPPVETVTLFLQENSNKNRIELEIPLPPFHSSEFSENFQYYPWQRNFECYMEADIEESIYSTILEDPLPLSLSEFTNFETPICPNVVDNVDDVRFSVDYDYATIKKPKIPQENSESDSSIDSPDPFYKNVKSKLENPVNIKPKHNTSKKEISKIINATHNNTKGSSPNSNETREITISKNNIPFNAPIDTEYKQSSISSMDSYDKYAVENPITNSNLANTAKYRVTVDYLLEKSIEQSTERIEILPVEDQSFKIQNPNTENIVAGSKSISADSIDCDQNILVNHEIVNPDISLIPDFTLSRSEQLSPPQSNDIIDGFHKSHHTSDNSLSDKHSIKDQKSELITPKNNNNTKVLKLVPRLPPKPKNYQDSSSTLISLEPVSNDRMMQIEKQGKSLYFSTKL